MIPDSDQLNSVLAEFLPDAELRQQAAQKLTGIWKTEDLDGAVLDIGRAARCGFPEVIYGEGKQLSVIVEILQRQRANSQFGFVTRVADEFVDELQHQFPDGIHNPVAQDVPNG